MRDDKSGIQAWIACNDILNKIKTELITEAMDTVKDAMDLKLIEFKGSLVNLPDKPSDTEMYMFMINRLVEERERIMHAYNEYLGQSVNGAPSAERLVQIERLKKFLLCVERISMLMHYSGMIDEWMHDVAMQVAAKDIPSIIRATSSGNAERVELLGYVIRNQVIEREKVFTKDEREFLAASLPDAEK